MQDKFSEEPIPAPPLTFEYRGKRYESIPCEVAGCRREHAFLPCGIAAFDYHPVEEGE